MFDCLSLITDPQLPVLANNVFLFCKLFVNVVFVLVGVDRIAKNMMILFASHPVSRLSFCSCMMQEWAIKLCELVADAL